MNAEDVRGSQTYRIHIPRRDNAAKHLTRDPDRAEVDIALAQLLIMCPRRRGCR